MTDSDPVKLAVVDYGMGNLRSVAKAFEHVGADVTVVTQASEVGDAAGLILPGVGAVGDCMEGLRSGGMDDFVRGWIREDRPFLGVCLGLQALFEKSAEGNVDCLGVFQGEVAAFDLPKNLKVPHMGWNGVSFLDDAPLNRDIPSSGEQFYFVHSYFVKPEDASIVWCESDYGGNFVSGVRKGSCFAVQFHPEKSQARGLQIYANFVQWVGDLVLG